MPRVPNFQFTGPTNLLPSPVLDSQRSINLYPESGLGDSKTRLGLIGRPGYTLFGTLPTSPVRALWPGNQRLFAVGGSHVYEVSSVGAVITDYGAMPQLGSGANFPCKFVQNGGSAAFQLLVYNPKATGASNIFNVDSGGFLTGIFHGTDMSYLDGFQLAIASGASLANSGNPNQINTSAFGDATNWTPLPGPLPTYVIRTGSSDLVNGLAVQNAMAYFFGAQNLEFWYDAGTAGFPLARMSGGQLAIGLASPWSIVKFLNCIMFLGADATGHAQVYMMQGMNPLRVSTPSVEYLISLQTNTGGLPGVTAFGYQEAGHTFYVLTFPSSGYQIVYDLTTGLWHERTYANILPWCFASLAGFGFGSNGGANFVGDALSGNIYVQSIQTPSDNGTAITYTRQSGPVFVDNMVHTFDRFELDCDIGTAAATLNWSNDGGRNFGTQARAMKQAANQGGPSGAPWGTRYFVNQMGRSRDMRLQVNITSSTQLVRIAQGLLDCDNTGPPTEDA